MTRKELIQWLDDLQEQTRKEEKSTSSREATLYKLHQRDIRDCILQGAHAAGIR